MINGARHYIIYPELINNSTDSADSEVTKKVKIMKNFKFSHFVSNIALNGISIAAYSNADKTIYKLVAEENGAKIRGTHIVELTVNEYEDLPHNPYNSTRRFLHVASMCGINFR